MLILFFSTLFAGSVYADSGGIVESGFHIGTYQLHANPNINYQLNRQIAIGADVEEIKEVAGKIKNLNDWKIEFLRMAERAISEGRIRHAAAYYRGVEFFMSHNDSERKGIYQKCINLFRENLKTDFETGRIQEIKVKYNSGFLPVWRLPVDEGKKRKTVIVLHGGFDSLKEELYPVADLFRNKGFEVLFFEGPGQGEALNIYGLPMTHMWEKPVSAILDHFDLDNVTLIGLSMGGYLAPRAAAFENRIKLVVAWGPFFGVPEVFSYRSEKGAFILNAMISIKAAPVVNALVEMRMERDFFVNWSVNQWMHVLGVESPYAFFKVSKNYTLKDISHLITQDFLLMAGKEDHFIDLDIF